MRCEPPSDSVAVCATEPSSYTQIEVVLPPISTAATPCARSSPVSEPVAAASEPSTISSTWIPASSTHLVRFCTAETAPVTMCVSASSRAPYIPTGSETGSVPSIQYPRGITCRIWRFVGMLIWPATSIARARSSAVIGSVRSAMATIPRLFCELRCPPAIPTTPLRIRIPHDCSAFSTAVATASRADWMLSITPRERPAAGATPTPSTRACPYSFRSATSADTFVEPMSMAAMALLFFMVPLVDVFHRRTGLSPNRRSMVE